MNLQDELLNRLLNKYERSGHCLPGKSSNRRVGISLNEAEFPYYQRNRRERVEEVNAIIGRMQTAGLVTFRYRKGYEGWLIDKIYLNLERIPDAYRAVGRLPASLQARKLLEVLTDAYMKTGRPWVRRLIEDEQKRLREKFRASRLLPDKPGLAKDLFSVLQAAEKEPQLMRVLSVQCFQDSKHLERELLGFLLSIARHYEPDTVTYSHQSEERLTDNEVLAQIGILRYPEIFELCGDIILTLEGTSIPTAPFARGFCLQSETLAEVQGIRLDGIHRVYFVENRTNYRALVLRGIPPDVLLIYHGGFYSPAHGRLFQQIARAARDDTLFYFWGDLDLGGFQMFERLRKNIIPGLHSYRMNSSELYRYLHTGKSRSADYLHRLEQFQPRIEDPAIRDGIAAILKTGITVEQESMLDDDMAL